jgi:hypothetical protein
MAKVQFTEEQYFAAACNDGWDICDEDTAQEYCENNLADVDILSADVAFWHDKFVWYKAKP